jgi:hypothetical protein
MDGDGSCTALVFVCLKIAGCFLRQEGRVLACPIVKVVTSGMESV